MTGPENAPYGFVPDGAIEHLRGPDLTIDKVVSQVSEEAIFQFVLGYVPEEYDMVVNPFRDDDRNPGCYWTQGPNDRLVLVDYATNEKVCGVSLGYFDCVGAVQIRYKLRVLEALEYILENVDVHDYPDIEPIKRFSGQEIPTIIQYRPRVFNNRDKRFWFDRYGITRAEMLEDGTEPVASIHISSRRTSGRIYVKRPFSSSYAFNLPSGHKKIYMPHEVDRFISNCTQDDIGGDTLPADPTGKDLMVTKSYKDYRVLKNAGVPLVVWFQNEGSRPTMLKELCKGFRSVIFLFDNDRQGLFASHMLTQECGNPNARAESVPIIAKNIEDPADLRHRRGQRELINFLKQKKIL